MDICYEIKRVLKPEGSLWLNLGDTFNGNKRGNTNNAQKKGVNTLTFQKRVDDIIPNKSLCMIPERLAIILTEYGWCLRNKVIWFKPNAMPQSAPDRFNLDWEYLYHFTVRPKGYYFEQQYRPYAEDSLRPSKYNRKNPKKDNYRQGLVKFKIPEYPKPGKDGYTNAIKLGWDGKSDYADWYFNGRHKKSWHDHSNDKVGGYGQQSRKQKPPIIPYPYGSKMRSVWKISTRSFKDAHFATFPIELLETPIKATCPEGGIVLDPFMGSGTTALAALKLNRRFLGIELNQSYIDMAYKRLEPYMLQTRLVLD
jgi:DNA modification methylase